METTMPDQRLSELLKKHYDSFYPDDNNKDASLLETCDECREKVISYLEANPSIAHENILFIKKFTKVAKNIVDSGQLRLEPLMERLYDYHMDGITKAQQEIAAGSNNEEWLAIVKSHLHGHASNLAFILFNSVFSAEDIPFQRKMYWGNEAYNNGAMSIETSELNVARLCVKNDYMGKVSKRVYDLLCTQETPVEKKIVWLERYQKHKHASAEMSARDDFVNEGKRRHQSSEAANLIFLEMLNHGGFTSEEKIYWLQLRLDDSIEAARLIAAEYPNISAYRLKDSAEALAGLYGLTGDPRHIHECYRMYSKAAGMTVNSLPSFSASMDRCAGDAAMKISEADGNGRWKRKAERHYQKYLKTYTSTSYVMDGTRARSRWKTNIDRVKGDLRKINRRAYKPKT